LATLLTLSALIWVFVVTNQTSHQRIYRRIVDTLPQSRIPYQALKWTPETWFEAVLDVPMARSNQRNDIVKNVQIMAAWRWMLIPILLVDVVAFGVSMVEVVRQRKMGRRGFVVEK